MRVVLCLPVLIFLYCTPGPAVLRTAAGACPCTQFRRAIQSAENKIVCRRTEQGQETKHIQCRINSTAQILKNARAKPKARKAVRTRVLTAHGGTPPSQTKCRRQRQAVGGLNKGGKPNYNQRRINSTAHILKNARARPKARKAVRTRCHGRSMQQTQATNGSVA